MYIVLQFGKIWMIYDREAGSSHLLESDKVNYLTREFPAVFGDGILNVVQISKINPNKLLQLPESGYVIVRLGETWTICESGREGSRLLQANQISSFKQLFPVLIDSQMLVAIAVDSINPAKLASLPVTRVGQHPVSGAGGAIHDSGQLEAKTGVKAA